MSGKESETNVLKGERQGSTLGISRQKKRHIRNKVASGIVTLGGWTVILGMVAIVAFIVFETLPLWRPATAKLSSTYNLKSLLKSIDLSPVGLQSLGPSEIAVSDIITPEIIASKVIAIGQDEYREINYLLTTDGTVVFFSSETLQVIESFKLNTLSGEQISSAAVTVGSNVVGLGTTLGRVLPIKIDFKIAYDEDGKRLSTPTIEEKTPIQMSSEALTMAHYVADEDDDVVVSAAITHDGRLLLYTEEKWLSLFGEGEKVTMTIDLTSDLVKRTPTVLRLEKSLDHLYVGTSDGKLLAWDIGDLSSPKLIDTIDATGDYSVPVTSLGFLLGGVSLVVGDGLGGVSVWFQVEDKASALGKKLEKVHVFPSQGASVSTLAPSLRNKGFISGDSDGNVFLNYSTSGSQLLEFKGNGAAVAALSYAPRADGILILDQNGDFFDWVVDNPHPETNFKMLFGKIWYEGYDKPEFVWQSTGGTDEFEPKMSLTPLMFGTIKGTLYSLLFAIPLGILSAICVSQFMHPSLRGIIKPVIELMAAMPSVVLGFLAGLWLAPLIEEYVPGVFLFLLIAPVLVILAVAVWMKLPKSFKVFFRDGTELFLLIPVLIFGVLICAYLNAPIQQAFLAGDYRLWFFDVLGITYDQRNALIVGFAMGFAAIPIIFTISEDALSNVPKNLISGSLALGANRWQTTVHVVLPTASAAIFSAVMIGLGRVVGETMIVLMATGNTPIIDWNIFSGFRALSANIAVEIPEAPHGGTLYRVLFVAAFLLFAMTFVVNTIAEIVRMRLRKKYGNL